MAMQNGPMAGYPMESLKVRLYDGSFHPVDSDLMSFEICAKIAFKESCKKVTKHLMEPIMKVEVVTPDEYIGNVTGDLNRRRAILEQIEAKVGVQVIKATVPMSEMFGYVTALRTLTSGRGTSTLTFSHYAEMPKDMAENVVEKERKS